MSTVKRSVYQKLAEKHKSLMNDIRIITMLEEGYKDRFKHWRKHFTDNDAFAEMMHQYAKKYVMEHPKEFEWLPDEFKK